jgi:hypothetical protein
MEDISWEELPDIEDLHETYPHDEQIVARIAPMVHQGRIFNKKTITIAQGTPLPAKFPMANGALVFVVEKNLSISFNGEQIPADKVSRTQLTLSASANNSNSTAAISNNSSVSKTVPAITGADSPNSNFSIRRPIQIVQSDSSSSVSTPAEIQKVCTQLDCTEAKKVAHVWNDGLVPYLFAS